ncbi:MAG: hypothetical protein IPJ77_04640 [Planctomycetes bacterium]|nr:hypothetical protein [Planctomycetota bacterium]
MLVGEPVGPTCAQLNEALHRAPIVLAASTERDAQAALRSILRALEHEPPRGRRSVALLSELRRLLGLDGAPRAARVAPRGAPTPDSMGALASGLRSGRLRAVLAELERAIAANEPIDRLLHQSRALLGVSPAARSAWEALVSSAEHGAALREPFDRLRTAVDAR